MSDKALKLASRNTHKRGHVSVVSLIVCIIFSLYAIILVVPYIYGLLVSFESQSEFENSLFPSFRSFAIDNYAKAWQDLGVNDTSVLQMLGNSLWYSVGMVVIGCLYSVCGAYVVATYRFKGSRFIHGFALVAMMIPIIGAASSNLKFTSALGGYDSPLYIIIQAQSIGGSFIIMYGVFKGIDKAYSEAAFIDGAGHFGVFFKIMLPQVISPLSALALSDFITYWADSETPLIYFPDLPTLASGLFSYQKVVETYNNYPVYYAGLMMCMLPTLLLFAIFHNKMMDIQLGGGLKG